MYRNTACSPKQSYYNLHDTDTTLLYYQEGADYQQNEFSHCAEPCQNLVSPATTSVGE